MAQRASVSHKFASQSMTMENGSGAMFNFGLAGGPQEQSQVKRLNFFERQAFHEQKK